MEEKTKYKLVDQEHNTWMCQECGFMASFEADGPFENGWNVCPHCGDAILPPRRKAATQSFPPAEGGGDVSV